jgi:CAAX protease family protein
MVSRPPPGAASRAPDRAGVGPRVAIIDPLSQLEPPAPTLPGFWWRVLSPLGAVVVALAALIVLFACLSASGMGENSRSAVATTATGALLLAFALVLWRGLPAHERRRALGIKGSLRRAILVGLGGGIGLVIVSQAILLIGVALDPGARRRLDELGEQLGPSPWQVGLTVASLVALAPIGEELLFRALLLRALARRLPFWAAALVSSVAFASAHVDAFFLWPRAIALVATGLGLAWLYRRRGYLACVLAHATINGVAAIALLAGS